MLAELSASFVIIGHGSMEMIQLTIIPFTSIYIIGLNRENYVAAK